MNQPSCLRCPAAKCNGLTNFAEARPFITCGVTGRGTALKLEPCAIAPPKETRYASEVELGYLRVHDGHRPIHEVLRIIGRKRGVLHAMRRRHGFCWRPDDARRGRAISIGLRHKSPWTASQDAYIVSLPESAWPARGQQRAQDLAMRAAIVQGVRERGGERSWAAISNRRYVLSPAGRRQAEKVRKLKREKNAKCKSHR